MNVLIIGGGGREHALAWRIRQSNKVEKIFVAPGNAGTALIAENLLLSGVEEIINFLKLGSIDLVIVGPDEYLAQGVVDHIHGLDIPVFGPTRAAAEIEWSKKFAKDFMRAEGIPTACYSTFADLNQALEYVYQQEFPLVIKASGLASGKGVVIADNLQEAIRVLTNIMKNKIFGPAGNEVVIEEYLVGREISIHAFCDGDHAILFPASQDHKRIYSGDEGPNTGGMGTIAPVPWVTEVMMEQIKQKIILPTLNGLKRMGRPFVGVLYPGVMVTEQGPIIETCSLHFAGA